MTDKIVTHEDRNTLADAFRWIDGVPVGQEAIGGKRRVLELLTRLIAAAEADAPPLPEGWVLLDDGTGTRRVLMHQDAVLALWDDMTGVYASVNSPGCGRDRLTPLRPIVTEADVEKAARAARAAFLGGPDSWDEARQDVRDDWMKTARATLDALGIEVTS